MATMSKLTFDPPAEFLEEEMTITWRTPRKAPLKEARMLQAQLAIRPNMIVNRRLVNPESELSKLAAETVSKLFESIPGVSGIETTELQFKDGKGGVLLEFNFPTAGYTVVQMHAMRVDDGVLTTLALSTEKSRFTPEEQQRFKQCLASASLA